jgi:hypothetical protein
LKVKELGKKKITPRLGPRGINAGAEDAKVRREEKGGREIPPLRGPTRHKSARKKKSGRSGRDDNLGRCVASIMASVEVELWKGSGLAIGGIVVGLWKASGLKA